MKYTSFSVGFSQSYSVIPMTALKEIFSANAEIISIHCQYRDILSLVRYGSIYVLVCIWCLGSAADVVSSTNWFTGFKVLNVVVLTILLHLNNFGLGLSSVADLSSTSALAPTSAECVPCLNVWRVMRLGQTVWIWVMVIFRWLFFLSSSIDVTLIDE